MTDAPPAEQSAVIVPVVVAEAVVGHHRAELDVAAGWGVPAHVTVLYPFVEPHLLDEQVVQRLAAVVAGVPAFACRFARCGWFGEEVLWLAPEPAHPFAVLTERVAAAFPGHPPYGGAHADVVPHLTVGERRLGSPARLRAAEADVAARLPLDCRVDHALLVAGSERPDSWTTVARLPLGGSGGTAPTLGP